MGVLYGVFAWFYVVRVSLSEPLGNSFAATAALGLCNGANIAATCHQPPKHVSHSKSTREKRVPARVPFIFSVARRSLSSQPFFAPYFCVDVCACPFPARSFHLRPLFALYFGGDTLQFRCIYDFGKWEAKLVREMRWLLLYAPCCELLSLWFYLERALSPAECCSLSGKCSFAIHQLSGAAKKRNGMIHTLLKHFAKKFKLHLN